MTHPQWRGVFPAALTHFNDDMTINMDMTTRHLEAMLEAGIHGLVMLGTCGENNSLEPEEKYAVLEAAIKTVRGRVPVITGVSELTTARAVRFAQKAEAIGVNGLMVLPAMAYKADSREVIHHFQSVARAVKLPVMVYNNPVSYNVDIGIETLKVLADEPNIVCVKESSDNPRRITDLYNAFGNRFIIFAGVDDLALESLMLGATGWISGLVSAFPRENRLLWDMAMAGRWQEAMEVYRWYTPCLHLDTHVKLVQYIKLAAQECGYGSENVRPPRLKLEGREREEVLALVRKAIATRPKKS
ncbi:MAG TPA: dihydrodipicolinate synthase family protein [Fibrobacteres bacterium]|jgi:dihydrodipicolinate synthase/N-acetylneuraminate lyase|nr:dihydrodipicolinate synthase family protein [Fibrobacterota bacterium]